MTPSLYFVKRKGGIYTGEDLKWLSEAKPSVSLLRQKHAFSKSLII
jgi:hypothetical protein